ncbi:unnamed protein product [Eruca vesicaria subsp. sativa]|uniref:Uncharacterized protein n=1 Tax=Eruca vesicaria subsp. sativa TaxID=29727 RepID=A0ABC8KXL3_ERUVS|nr:unnamed protein product [Eruca vesicaria subsp. sativa]
MGNSKPGIAMANIDGELLIPVAHSGEEDHNSTPNKIPSASQEIIIYSPTPSFYLLLIKAKIEILCSSLPKGISDFIKSYHLNVVQRRRHFRINIFAFIFIIDIKKVLECITKNIFVLKKLLLILLFNHHIMIFSFLKCFA